MKGNRQNTDKARTSRPIGPTDPAFSRNPKPRVGIPAMARFGSQNDVLERKCGWQFSHGRLT